MRTRSIWPDRRQPIAPIADDSIDRPTILRRRSPAEIRDHHLATIRASMLCLGLHEEQVERVADEIEAMAEEAGR